MRRVGTILLSLPCILGMVVGLLVSAFLDGYDWAQEQYAWVYGAKRPFTRR